MGFNGEDRLPVRKLAFGFILCSAAVAGAVPVGFLTGEPGRLLTTFLGLVSASILPTISLLVGSLSAVGRSVKGIGDLHDEFAKLISDLWKVLKMVALSVGGLAISSLPLDHAALTFVINGTQVDFAEIALRLGQAFAGGAIASAVLRFGDVPRVLRRVLEIRYQIAIDEARRKIEEKAPNADRIAAIFPTRQGFGEVKGSLTGQKEPTNTQ